MFVNKNRATIVAPNSIGKNQHSYALTISSNHARLKDSYKAYKYIIKQLPTGVYYYTYEQSLKGKYHIHGLMQFKYKFDYPNLMKAKQTEGDYSFDVHIRYDKIIDQNSLDKWLSYATKQDKNWKIYKTDSTTTKITKIPKTCIPQVKFETKERDLLIPNLGITKNASTLQKEETK